MSIYECTMVDSEREPTPDVRCTNVEQHTMDVDFSTLYIHPSYDQREDPTEPVDGSRELYWSRGDQPSFVILSKR